MLETLHMPRRDFSWNAMIPRHSFKLILLLGAWSFWPSLIHADQWNVGIENDLLFGDDGDYSNGFVFGWQVDPQNNFDHASWPFNWQKSFAFSQSSQSSQWGAKLSQRMWTPKDIVVDVPQPFERPYAGLLELESFTASFSDTLAQKNWVAIGVMGPASGAQSVQEFVHKSTGSQAPEGWKYQVKNEVTLQLAYEVDTLLIRRPAFSESQWDLSAYSHSMLGNFRSETNLGVTLRWGDKLGDTFGQLSSQSGHFGNFSSSARAGGSWTVFARAQAGYRFNDLTIEGDLPYDSFTQVKHEQGEAAVGFVWAFPTWSLRWSFNIYSKEFESDTQRWHGFGVLSSSWIF